MRNIRFFKAIIVFSAILSAVLLLAACALKEPFELGKLEPALLEQSSDDPDYVAPTAEGFVSVGENGIFVFNKTYLLRNHFVSRDGDSRVSLMVLKAGLKVNKKLGTLAANINCDTLSDVKQTEVRLNGQAASLQSVKPGNVPVEVRIRYPNEQSGAINCELSILSSEPGSKITKNIRIMHE